MQKNIMQLLSITALTTIILNVWGDTIYKCKDRQGALLYQKTPCKEKNKIDIQTANGSIKVCSATIKKLNFGPFFIKDVKTLIAPKLSQPWLGMNVLQQLKMVQEKGEMRLSTRE